MATTPLRNTRNLLAAIRDWREGDFLAIDVAVTSPLINSSVRLEEPCEEYARTQKHAKYDSSFVGTNYAFCAMVFDFGRH